MSVAPGAPAAAPAPAPATAAASAASETVEAALSPPSYAGLVPATADRPHNPLVTPMLTDMYQLSMAYAYWRAGRSDEPAVFDLFFRKSPFGGEFTVFAGLEEVLRFVQTFAFSPADIEYLRGSAMKGCDPAFFDYLAGLDCSALTLSAAAEGSVVFPRVPLIVVSGPLGLCQLLETTLLNLTNYASLVATNAARFRIVAGPSARMLEFGLRRAQGPDGGLSASRYALIGGFDGSSNVAACATTEGGYAPSGSHAHALVSSFSSADDLPSACRTLNGVDVLARAAAIREALGYTRANDGELAAFVCFATSFPERFTALVDTYDTLASGVPNFIAVAFALEEAGARAYGIRLDSGDLAYLSLAARRLFAAADAARPPGRPAGCPPLAQYAVIMASNDINEAVLTSLGEQGHSIDAFGIGTHLVTCQAQPALGMVYKLVEVSGSPRLKLSNDASKVSLPGEKEAFRLLGADGAPLLDLVIRAGEARPQPGRRQLVRHPFDEKKRAYVTPTAVLPLLRVVWLGARAGGAPGAPPRPGGALRAPFPPLRAVAEFLRAQLALLRGDHLRAINPTPYKVSVSPELFHFLHELWATAVPVPELS